MKKIMILGASILQLPAIQKAKEMGLEVIAVDMNPEAIGFAVPGVIKEVISTIDTPAILESARKHQIIARRREVAKSAKGHVLALRKQDSGRICESRIHVRSKVSQKFVQPQSRWPISEIIQQRRRLAKM